MAKLPKLAGDTQHVITPCADALFGEMVEIKFEIAGEFLGVDE